ncbi:MAG: histidinol dehydrogenase [Xanthomonadales bacterium]|nr:histidinol dehydrogenase [Xanthomonadales bacterium]
MSPEEQREALMRPQRQVSDLFERVADIIREVRSGGDEALVALTEAFDGIRVTSIRIDRDQLVAARAQCPDKLLRAMADAERCIRTFHAADIPAGARLETSPGMQCEVRYHPIEPVGLYVPGGSAPLLSTVLMLGVPAKLAGCRNVVLCTPPGPDGSVVPEVLAAASLCDIEQVFAVGGAQAIAAMAYGTPSVPRCSKIFGPGNAWVTEAKQQVSMDPQGAAIDLPAGPSEVLVIADDTADPVCVAWDLLSQAEHGPDSQVILLTDDRDRAAMVVDHMVALAARLPRAQTVEASMAATRVIVVDDLAQALSIANRYAPEHLIVNCRNPRRIADQARNAGSIFIGPWTPESLGDYCSGTNHVLPTYGWARSHSALSVNDFMRRFTVQEASFEALATLGVTAETLATFEGLEAHRMAVRHRLSGEPS